MVSWGCGEGWLASRPPAKLTLAILGPCHSTGVVILRLPPDRRRPVCGGGDCGQSPGQNLSHPEQWGRKGPVLLACQRLSFLVLALIPACLCYTAWMYNGPYPMFARPLRCHSHIPYGQ